MADYVLYVGYDRRDGTRFCPGSRKAIELVDEAGAQDRVTVQSIDALRESVSALPPWLNGTPTLVCRTTKKAMRGSAVLEHLRHELVEKRPAEEAQGGTQGTQGGHSMDGMVAPGEAAHLGLESNFEPLVKDDPDKYDDSRKVTEGDLQRLLERRKATIPPA